MVNVLLVIHVLAAIGIVVLVLLQQGRGADMGAAFGGGAQTLFGARGSATFLSRVTTWLAAVFFLTSLSLAYVYTGTIESRSVTEETAPQSQPVPTQSDLPAGEIPDVPTDDNQPQTDEVPAVPQPGESGNANNKADIQSGDAPK